MQQPGRRSTYSSGDTAKRCHIALSEPFLDNSSHSLDGAVTGLCQDPGSMIFVIHLLVGGFFCGTETVLTLTTPFHLSPLTSAT